MEPEATEYRVTVTDGGPLVGAMVYLDGVKAKVQVTDSEGRAILHVTKGQHVVHVDAKDLQMTREVDAVGGKVRALLFDLPAERRRMEAGQGDRDRRRQSSVRRQTQAGRGCAASPSHAETATPGSFAPSPPPDDDDGISLPSGFAMAGLQMPTSVEQPTQVQAGMQAGTDVGFARKQPAASVNPGPANSLGRYQRCRSSAAARWASSSRGATRCSARRGHQDRLRRGAPQQRRSRCSCRKARRWPRSTTRTSSPCSTRARRATRPSW